jgi:hypothetical protein
VFGILPDRPIPNFSTQLEHGAVIRYDANAGQRNLDLLRWGLIPYANIKMTPPA